MGFFDVSIGFYECRGIFYVFHGLGILLVQLLIFSSLSAVRNWVPTGCCPREDLQIKMEIIEKQKMQKYEIRIRETLKKGKAIWFLQKIESSATDFTDTLTITLKSSVTPKSTPEANGEINPGYIVGKTSNTEESNQTEWENQQQGWEKSTKCNSSCLKRHDQRRKCPCYIIVKMT